VRSEDRETENNVKIWPRTREHIMRIAGRWHQFKSVAKGELCDRLLKTPGSATDLLDVFKLMSARPTSIKESGFYAPTNALVYTLKY